MRTVYILGAGASAESNAPTVNNFMGASKQAVTGEFLPYDLKERYEKILNIWKSYHPAINIEEFYILAETIERLDMPKGSFPSAEDVRGLIGMTLQQSMARNENSKGRKAYIKFVNSLSRRANEDCIISLNWDVALETASQGSRLKIRIPHAKIKKIGDLGFGINPLEHSIPLIKLHGSMNWWFCSSCRTLFDGGNEKAIVDDFHYGGSKICENDCWTADGRRSRLIPAMLPPGTQKLGAGGGLQPLFAPLWAKALNHLEDSQRIVIIGYSIPPTDSQFRSLLAKTVLGSRQKEIIIVTKARKADKRFIQQEYAERIGLNNPAKLKIYTSGFSEWVSHGRQGFPK